MSDSFDFGSNLVALHIPSIDSTTDPAELFQSIDIYSSWNLVIPFLIESICGSILQFWIPFTVTTASPTSNVIEAQ